MSEDKLVRLENLKRLMKERNLTIASLEADVGGRYTYWRDLLGGDKSFGEKAARKIEDRFKLPRGWLDNDTAALPPPEIPPEIVDLLNALNAQRRVAAWRIFESVLQGELEVQSAPELSEDTTPAPAQSQRKSRGQGRASRL